MRFKLITALTGLMLITIVAGNSLAVTHTVNQVGLTFQPETIDIQVGDTVEWIWTAGIHTVTNGVDLADPELGTLFDAPLDAANPSFSYTFDSIGEFPYICRPHVTLGMVGVVRVTSGVTHTVNQVNLTFQPEEITINVGDTVEWVWSALIHTVTNGTDLGDPGLGTLFDAPLDASNPIFSFTFFEAGDVPYLCRPHFVLGMTGIVHVNTVSPVQETPDVAPLSLYQNSPNPFNPSTRITFEIPGVDGSTVPTTLRIYDLQGRLVRTLLAEPLPAARHTVTWNGRNDRGEAMASGVYLYRLQTGDLTASRQMTLMK